MKYEDEYENWKNSFEWEYDTDYSMEAWTACEQMYEARRCDGCVSNQDMCHKETVQCSKMVADLGVSAPYGNTVRRDFYCKYWEAKP